MIYQRPADEESIDQGDIIDACPVVSLADYDLDDFELSETEIVPARLLILTQTCDLANEKASKALAAVVLDAKDMVDRGLMKVQDLRGPIRAGRVFGWYFLPQSTELGLPEMIVDLRQLHTVRLDLLADLCRRGNRSARLLTPYREHLAQHLSNTYGRIGLPEPYETL